MDEKKTKKEEDVKKTVERKEIIPSDEKCEGIGYVYVGQIKHSVFLTDFKVNPNLGQYFPVNDKIYLNRTVSPHQQLIILIHEMLHSISIEYSMITVISQSPYQSMESIIGLFDSPITNDLILNPVNTAFFARVLDGEFTDDK